MVTPNFQVCSVIIITTLKWSLVIQAVSLGDFEDITSPPHTLLHVWANNTSLSFREHSLPRLFITRWVFPWFSAIWSLGSGKQPCQILNHFGLLGFQEKLSSHRKIVNLPAFVRQLFNSHGSGREKQFIPFCFCSGLCYRPCTRGVRVEHAMLRTGCDVESSVPRRRCCLQEVEALGMGLR